MGPCGRDGPPASKGPRNMGEEDAGLPALTSPLQSLQPLQPPPAPSSPSSSPQLPPAPSSPGSQPLQGKSFPSEDRICGKGSRRPGRLCLLSRKQASSMCRERRAGQEAELPGRGVPVPRGEVLPGTTLTPRRQWRPHCPQGSLRLSPPLPSDTLFCRLTASLAQWLCLCFAFCCFSLFL